MSENLRNDKQFNLLAKIALVCLSLSFIIMALPCNRDALPETIGRVDKLEAVSNKAMRLIGENSQKIHKNNRRSIKRHVEQIQGLDAIYAD